jgi:hypothetical protein
VYDEGWGPDAARLVRHTRHVFFIKPSLFVIADELEPADGKAHTYDALFHLDAAEVKVDGLQVATQDAGASLALLAFGADGVSLVKGQKEPAVQGWLPDSSSGYGGIRPIPTAVYRRQAQGKATLLYALSPSASPAPCPVKSLQLAGDALSVTLVDGSSKVYRFSPCAGLPAQSAP